MQKMEDYLCDKDELLYEPQLSEQQRENTFCGLQRTELSNYAQVNKQTSQ